MGQTPLFDKSGVSKAGEYLFMFIIGIVVGIGMEDSFEYRKISVDECAKILDNQGYTVTRGTMQSGAKYLGVLKGKSGFQVNFYGCEGDKDCLGMVFIVGFDRIKGASIERINYWNAKTKLLKAYVDGSSAVLEMDVPIEGGVTESYLKKLCCELLVWYGSVYQVCKWRSALRKKAIGPGIRWSKAGERFMRTAAIIISIIIAIVIAATISGVVGVLIALAMVGYQVIRDYGSSETVRARRTVRGARLTDIARNCVFLIPLIVALAGGAWIAAAATVVVYGINFYMS